jgi:hypothetical protein
MIVHNCVCFLQSSPTRSWFRTLGKLRTRGLLRGSAPTTDYSERHPGRVAMKIAGVGAGPMVQGVVSASKNGVDQRRRPG